MRPKHVGGLQLLYCNKFTYFMVFFS